MRSVYLGFCLLQCAVAINVRAFDSEVNPEEMGEFIEGDIILPAGISKNGLLSETSHWPNGIVPYEINGYFTTKERGMINKSMELYHKYTCVKFRKRMPTDVDWISIVNWNSGCWSNVGRIGNKQEVNYQSPNCFAKIGTVMHELLHALGFYHEQNRWERDDFIKVHYENVQKGKENNFDKVGEDKVSGFGIPYDYQSVMHYSEKAFSKNGEPTISVIGEKNVKIGQREGFSKSDIMKVRAMYGCSNTDEDVNVDNSVVESGGNNAGLIGELISIVFPHSSN